MLHYFIKLLTALFFTGCVFIPIQHFEKDSPIYFKANPTPLISKETLSAQSKKHKVLVAVIDSGVDYNHPGLQKNLRANISLNKGDIGLDILGLDGLPYPIFYDPKSLKKMDDILGQNDHGTHVASISLTGGLYQNAQGENLNAGELIGLIPIRTLPLDDEGIPDAPSGEHISKEEEKKHKEIVDEIVVNKVITVLMKAADFAKAEGAKVANMSLGIEGSSLTQKARIQLKTRIKKELFTKMISTWSSTLFVFAAGNDGIPVSDENFPAALKHHNMITVGALANSHEIADYSNFGNKVDVYIRGSDINGMVPEGKRDKMSGTSMATPFVSNLAAKILLLAPCLKPSEVRKTILDGATLKTLKVAQSTIRRKVLVASFKNSLSMATDLGKNCQK